MPSRRQNYQASLARRRVAASQTVSAAKRVVDVDMRVTHSSQLANQIDNAHGNVQQALVAFPSSNIYLTKNDYQNKLNVVVQKIKILQGLVNKVKDGPTSASTSRRARYEASLGRHRGVACGSKDEMDVSADMQEAFGHMTKLMQVLSRVKEEAKRVKNTQILQQVDEAYRGISEHMNDLRRML